MRTTSKKFISSPRKVLAVLVAMLFLVNTTLPAAYAQGTFFLPLPGTQVNLSQGFKPVLLKAIKVHPDNPFQFDFVVDQGDTKLSETAFKVESQKLIRYFLASLTTPENDLWVNLSPYEKDRIIPESFGVTEMGRDLLAQDYLLKQITATLMYPEGEIGKKFWDRVHKQAFQKFGTTEIPTNTFNKVWIVPQKAVVYENGPTAYIDETYLKVMLEEDYAAMANQKAMAESRAPARDAAPNDLASSVIREIIIPELEKEVNHGTHFASLRQVYNSLILANWYKKRLKDSILSQVYVDKNKVSGVDIDDKAETQKIYQRYVEAFEKGVYSYIKEDYDPVSQESIPRKYFSGGVMMGMVGSSAVMDLRNGLPVFPSRSTQLRELEVRLALDTPQRSGGVADDWSKYAISNPRISGDLTYRLKILDTKLSLPRVDAAEMVVSGTELRSSVRIFDTQEIPLDLLREIAFYTGAVEAQLKDPEQNSISPRLYENTKNIFRKILVVAFVLNRSILQKLEKELAPGVSRALTAFMDGDNNALDAAQIRTIVAAIIAAGISVPDQVVIMLREPTVIEMRNEVSSLIEPAILKVAAQKGLTLNAATATRLAKVASRGDSQLVDNALARRGLTWAEILDQNDQIGFSIERIAAVDQRINKDIKILGESLLRIREGQELSQKTLAERSNVSLEIYQLYEEGKILRINPNHVLAFARELNIDVDELWPANDIAQIIFQKRSEKVFIAGSPITVPEDLRDYDKLSPSEQVEVKNKYRNANGNMIVPVDGFYVRSGEKWLSGIGVSPAFGEPVVYYDSSLNEPDYASAKKLVVESAEQGLSKFRERLQVLGVSFERFLEWGKVNEVPYESLQNELILAGATLYGEALSEYSRISAAKVTPATKEAVSSSAVEPVGGIDLSADKTELDIRSTGAPVEFNFDPKQIQNLKFDGFVPVIINVAPMTNLPLFLTENSDFEPSSTITKVN